MTDTQIPVTRSHPYADDFAGWDAEEFTQALARNLNVELPQEGEEAEGGGEGGEEGGEVVDEVVDTGEVEGRDPGPDPAPPPTPPTEPSDPAEPPPVAADDLTPPPHLTAPPTEAEMAAARGEEPPPPDPAPAPEQTPPDPNADLAAYFSAAYGTVPSVAELDQVLAFVDQVNATLTPEQQQQLNAWLAGVDTTPQQPTAPTLQPQPQPTPQPQPAASDDPYDPYDPYPTAPPAQQPTGQPAPTADPALTQRLEALETQLQQQKAIEHNNQIVSQVSGAIREFRAAHPYLSDAEVRGLASRVNRAGTWNAEYQRTGNAASSYANQLEAAVWQTPETRNKAIAAQGQQAPQSQQAPATTPPTASDHDRQALNGAIAGSSSAAASSTRRSPVSGGKDTPRATPKNKQEMAREAQRFLASSGISAT